MNLRPSRLVPSVVPATPAMAATAALVAAPETSYGLPVAKQSRKANMRPQNNVVPDAFVTVSVEVSVRASMNVWSIRRQNKSCLWAVATLVSDARAVHPVGVLMTTLSRVDDWRINTSPAARARLGG